MKSAIGADQSVKGPGEITIHGAASFETCPGERHAQEAGECFVLEQKILGDFNIAMHVIPGRNRFVFAGHFMNTRLAQELAIERAGDRRLAPLTTAGRANHFGGTGSAEAGAGAPRAPNPADLAKLMSRHETNVVAQASACENVETSDTA
jgi:hypothetical protein